MRKHVVVIALILIGLTQVSLTGLAETAVLPIRAEIVDPLVVDIKGMNGVNWKHANVRVVDLNDEVGVQFSMLLNSVWHEKLTVLLPKEIVMISKSSTLHIPVKLSQGSTNAEVAALERKVFNFEMPKDSLALFGGGGDVASANAVITVYPSY